MFFLFTTSGGVIFIFILGIFGYNKKFLLLSIAV